MNKTKKKSKTKEFKKSLTSLKAKNEIVKDETKKFKAAVVNSFVTTKNATKIPIKSKIEQINLTTKVAKDKKRATLKPNELQTSVESANKKPLKKINLSSFGNKTEKTTELSQNNQHKKINLKLANDEKHKSTLTQTNLQAAAAAAGNITRTKRKSIKSDEKTFTAPMLQNDLKPSLLGAKNVNNKKIKIALTHEAAQKANAAQNGIQSTAANVRKMPSKKIKLTSAYEVVNKPVLTQKPKGNQNSRLTNDKQQLGSMKKPLTNKLKTNEMPKNVTQKPTVTSLKNQQKSKTKLRSNIETTKIATKNTKKLHDNKKNNEKYANMKNDTTMNAFIAKKKNLSNKNDKNDAHKTGKSSLAKGKRKLPIAVVTPRVATNANVYDEPTLINDELEYFTDFTDDDDDNDDDSFYTLEPTSYDVAEYELGINLHDEDFDDDDDDESYCPSINYAYEQGLSADDLSDLSVLSDLNDSTFSTDECDSSDSFHFQPLDSDIDDDADDSSYKPPDDFLEDLIVHKGTATKRSLHTDDNVEFDSENEMAQIVELPKQTAVKTTEQTQCAEFQKQNNNLVVETIDIETDSCPELMSADDAFVLSDFSADTLDDDQFVSVDNYDDDFYSVSDDSDSIRSFVNITKYMPKNLGVVDGDSVAAQKNVQKLTVDIVDATTTNVHKTCKQQTPKYFDEIILDLPAAQQTDDLNKTKSAEIKVITINAPELFVSNNVDIENANINLALPIANIDVDDDDDDESHSDCDINITNEFETSTLQTNVNASENVANDIINNTNNNTLKSEFLTNIINNVVLVLVKEPLYFYGTVKFKVLAGAIEVYGYKVTALDLNDNACGDNDHNDNDNEYLEIFSIRGTAAVCITPLYCGNSFNINSKKLTQQLLYFNNDDVKKFLAKFNAQQSHALLLFERNEKRTHIIDIFREHMNENVFPNIDSMRMSHVYSKCICILQCVFNSSSSQELHVPIEWWQFNFNAQNRILLAGGKGVGKSTLLRFLINRHLSPASKYKRLLLIDLDIGQPEMFVPQTISCYIIKTPLLGSGFFKTKQPIKSFVIGHIDVTQCFDVYLAAVKKLSEFCQQNEDFVEMPWFINTMGYNKGVGLELISKICALLKPTDVIQIHSTKDINNFDEFLIPTLVTKIANNNNNNNNDNNKSNCILSIDLESDYNANYMLHNINAAVTQESRYKSEWLMSSKDLRYAMILARLSCVLRTNLTDKLNDCESINCALKSLKLVNLARDTNFSENQMQSNFENNLVYLCKSEATTAEQTQNVQAQQKEPLECLGIGFIKNVNKIGGTIDLIAALTESKCQQLLSEMNTLAICEMSLPNSLLIKENCFNASDSFIFNIKDDAATKAVKQFYFRNRKTV